MHDNYLLVFSNAADGRDEQFNTWYDQVHLPEVLAATGITRARRYVAGPETLGRPVPPNRYLALYDLGADPQSRLDGMADAQRRRLLTPGPADPSGGFVRQYQAFPEPDGDRTTCSSSVAPSGGRCDGLRVQAHAPASATRTGAARRSNPR